MEIIDRIVVSCVGKVSLIVIFLSIIRSLNIYIIRGSNAICAGKSIR